MNDYKNSDMVKVIDEYIHVERYRDVLKSRFIDGHTFETIAEEQELSVRQVKNIVYKYGEYILLKCIDNTAR